MLRETSTADAPWMVVEGSDERYRSLTIGRTILDALRRRLDEPNRVPHRPRIPASTPSIDGVSVIDRLDLDRKVDKQDYKDQLDELQGRLNTLTRHKKFDKLSVVAAFEGSDAAGKGGSIRRVTQALDARRYTVIPVAAPNDEEKARPYLWRFWRQLPERGRIAIFDRTWYGRVLVERVEKFCGEADWMRAYSEINDFEEQLVNNRTVVVKFWLQISSEEQLRRFKERQATPFKQHKITDEDWRNREKWDAYNQAVCDMIDRTSTELAPWKLVPANDKYFARLEVLRTLADAIEAAL
jgi:polyphosphate:AMP phosphotransferase